MEVTTKDMAMAVMVAMAVMTSTVTVVAEVAGADTTRDTADTTRDTADMTDTGTTDMVSTVLVSYCSFKFTS